MISSKLADKLASLRSDTWSSRKVVVSAASEPEKSNSKVKNTKKDKKNDPSTSKKEFNRVIMGIGQLFVVVSIAYSTSVIFIGVDGMVAKIALFPQAAFASYTLIKVFSRLYK